MAKGGAKKPDFKKAGEATKADEVDTLSTVDQGKDFVKAGER